MNEKYENEMMDQKGIFNNEALLSYIKEMGIKLPSLQTST
jgi:hypothetical protein